jgi:hypothetical protein
MDEITVSDKTTTIGGFVVEEPALAQLLAAHDEAEWPDLTRRALAVGAHTLLTAGVSVDLGDVDQTVRRAVADATAEAERQVSRLLEVGRASFAEHLDPAHRDSLLGKALGDFRDWRDSTLAGLDPDLDGSSAARLISGLAGQLEAFDDRLTRALDPAADGSGFAILKDQMEVLFRELYSQLGRQQGRQEEARVGTAKGVEFEDALEERLREIARSMGGCIVERTSRQGGSLGPEVLVGDFVLTLATGKKVVIEAKNQNRLALHGGNGILAELERAMANRAADAALCVSAVAAFPAEVGPLGLFGDVVLLVDDADGVLVEPAVRWTAALADSRSDSNAIDAVAIATAMDRIRSKARKLSDAKRALTEIGKSVAQVQDGLDDLRRELLEVVDEVNLGMRAGADTSQAA